MRLALGHLFEGGKKAVILGLRRDNGVGDVASLGIVNLGKQASQCQIKLFRADGSQIASTATLTFPNGRTNLWGLELETTVKPTASLAVQIVSSTTQLPELTALTTS